MLTLLPRWLTYWGLPLPSQGNLVGRVIHEALRKEAKQTTTGYFVAVSDKAGSGKSSVLFYQKAGDQLCLDEACFPSAKITKPHPVNKNPCR